ncbi:hypothetical protein [Bradyrhizobium sp. CCBAU 45394]|uniref:hypothetical protein n=1 Tax=Bradyrhizobium sp. CCBAU 45394 TaxID=1325087 RepID=UPI0023021363|nr:hypothetical protein [Bradyrhizobium sp. CCBAU 45394]
MAVDRTSQSTRQLLARGASAQIEIAAKHKDPPARGDHDSADVRAFAFVAITKTAA